MEYGFKLNKKNAEVQYKLDLQDCIITGNTVQYHLDDNSILAYDLDENGNVVGSSGKSVENVELTRTPLSIFKAVAEYADKNKNGFDKKDLKDLDKDDLAKVITSKLIEGGPRFFGIILLNTKKVLTISIIKIRLALWGAKFLTKIKTSLNLTFDTFVFTTIIGITNSTSNFY